jgi:hypothetical protein
MSPKSPEAVAGQDLTWRTLTSEAKSRFLDELRQARLVAQKNAEAFDELLFVFERLGCHRVGKAGTLGSYREALLHLLAESPLGKKLDSGRAVWHTDKEVLYRLVNQARNDALHQGARARHLTAHTIELALLFEDALMNGNEPMTTLGDIMVRSPTTADDWQPLSFVRQIMLTNSYSFLPIFWDGKWMIVSDAQVAAFLRRGSPTADERNRRLGMSLRDAHAKGLVFEKAIAERPETLIDSIAECPVNGVILVCNTYEKPDGALRERLVGIVTAFDIL